MGKFSPLDTAPVGQREESILKKWQEIDLLEKINALRKNAPPYVFFEGPPTANNKPGIHHVFGRTFKDEICRYQTMKGHFVDRKAGWDTHGLPVEIEVEKTLGLHNKQEIEKYGIQAFTEECRKSVFHYESMWRKMSERMGYMIDLDHPYITLDNDYIETVWYILDKMFQDGLLYEGHKILPYCPRCGTGLASHEVAQGYETIKTTTAYVKFRRKDRNEYFLAWTTTPWTLPSNVSLTVAPDVQYALIQLADTGEKLWMAKDLILQALGDANTTYDILEVVEGKKLEGIEYEQLIDAIPVEGKCFFVTVADYVTTVDGTGIVHTAPAFGEDDYQTGQRYHLPVVNPVDESGNFSTGPWKGINVFAADPLILEKLREDGKLLRKQKIEHNYPHCWRCHTPLIYYSKPSWYIHVRAFRDQMIEQNKTVSWFPPFAGEKRFGHWLENLEDWALSRSRYWGTPLPIWKCDACGHTDSIGSRAKLVERSVENIDETIDLHRPYVDACHLKCPKCGGLMSRFKDVIDVWFDSGSMPFAQWHYPFENKDIFASHFPADFVCEGIDQTRGWFYSLLAISTYLTGKAPYRNVLVNDLLLDKTGKKMSKSKGNTINPFDLFDKYGADVVRFYANYVSVPWVPTKFDEDGLKEVESKFIRSLRNIYTFFSLYCETEKIKPDLLSMPMEERDVLDRWVISRLHSLLAYIEENMAIFEVTKVSKAITEFIVEDVSNWYIRRSRRRFYTDDASTKQAAFQTTFEILLAISKIIAPFTPFIAEELYGHLGELESVHLEDYPNCDPHMIDLELEVQMDKVRAIVSLGRAAREKFNLKVRQPLSSILLDAKHQQDLQPYMGLIEDELNIKTIVFENHLRDFLEFEVKPNFKNAGPALGSSMGMFSQWIQKQSPDTIVSLLEKENFEIQLEDGVRIDRKDFFEIRVLPKLGYAAEHIDDLYVLLDTELSQGLIQEGYMREFISKVQQMRKQRGFDVRDHIRISFQAPQDVCEAVEKYHAYICEETLCDELCRRSLDAESVELNGVSVQIAIDKI